MEKCSLCKKKTLIFACKCSTKYCLKCLVAEVHSCSFDYKAEQRDKLKYLNKVNSNSNLVHL